MLGQLSFRPQERLSIGQYSADASLLSPGSSRQEPDRRFSLSAKASIDELQD